ncbi:hypothetical protein BDQ12DRAFT_684602 [Crucibulum laeve]|uniref:Uncharacterized protein n=1 Tax=Crucibulum laeve TaxID=68775 RepID=A0A5C3LXS6_9AGAR|nr:hypothetical protein BDQ12DRAFT_684602 [Crucibulum laeve]
MDALAYRSSYFGIRMVFLSVQVVSPHPSTHTYLIQIFPSITIPFTFLGTFLRIGSCFNFPPTFLTCHFFITHPCLYPLPSLFYPLSSYSLILLTSSLPPTLHPPYLLLFLLSILLLHVYLSLLRFVCVPDMRF